MKEARQAEILRIIAEQPVETQEQLLAQLERRGIHATQATISRDIKELRLEKDLKGGVYRYTRVEGQKGHRNHAGRLRKIFKEGVSSFDVAQNIVVIKTMPGLASAAGAALDGMDVSGLVGTLAGDDTVALIMRTNQDAEAFLDEIKSMFE